MKLTAARQQALKAIQLLSDESSRQEVRDVFSQSRKAFGKIKAFQPVESAAWDMALAGGCYGCVQSRLIDFAAQVNA